MSFNLYVKEEDREFFLDLGYFLQTYTTEVINKVIPRINEIKENKTACMLLAELRKRGEKEKEEFLDHLAYITFYYDTDIKSDYDFHNHCLTHSKSYRDILYDMYIR